MKATMFFGLWFAAVCFPAAASASDSAAERQLLWGDTHLHTSYSFDAFLNGNRTADPETAYRYARGYPVIHPYNRTRVQIGEPLDFLVVSDHAEFYGGIRDIYNDGIQDPDPGIIESLVYWYRENETALREPVANVPGSACGGCALARGQHVGGASRSGYLCRECMAPHARLRGEI